MIGGETNVRIQLKGGLDLNPEDVAWVVEWQLAAEFGWVPRGEALSVEAAPAADPDGTLWRVRIHIGQETVEARIPAAEIGRTVRWCYSIRPAALARPPAAVRGSLTAIRAALRTALARLDPLAAMGYAGAGR
jgi:hypothetical protein